MRISKVEGLLMSYPMPKPILLPFWGGERTILKRDALFIKITTDTGLIGYAPGPAHERAASEIHQIIQPFLSGKDPRNWRSFDFQAPLETQKTYHSVEIALADLVAKYEGCPLSETLGGRCRPSIKLYGSAGMYMKPEGYAEEAAAIANMGFPAYKMRPALGPDEDLRTVELMRQAVGPDVGLMIDAHAWWRMGDKNYSFDTVAELARSMAQYHPTWLEEPLLPDDHPAYEKLTALRHLPIASGEHEQEESGFMDLIQKKAVDYVQMDVFCQGGIDLGHRIFKATQENQLRFAFHSWGHVLEVLAAGHLGICWPESVVEWLEYPCYANNGRAGMYPFPLADEILKEPLDIQNGYLTLPTGPGLGIEIDERVVQKYPYLPGPWSIFKIFSPPESLAVTGDHSVKWVDPGLAAGHSSDQNAAT